MSVRSPDLGALFRDACAQLCVCVTGQRLGREGGRHVHVCIDGFRERSLSHLTHPLSLARARPRSLSSNDMK